MCALDRASAAWMSSRRSFDVAIASTMIFGYVVFSVALPRFLGFSEVASAQPSGPTNGHGRPVLLKTR